MKKNSGRIMSGNKNEAKEKRKIKNEDKNEKNKEKGDVGAVDLTTGERQKEEEDKQRKDQN